MISKEIMAVLQPLRNSDDKLVSILSDALTLPTKDTAATISALTTQRIQANKQTAPIVTALIKIDEHLIRARAIASPYATTWAPLVAECSVHATQDKLFETFEERMAKETPIFKVDRHTLCASIPFPLGNENFGRLSDRILRRVLKERVKRVMLMLSLHSARDRKFLLQCDALAADLKMQKIEVQTIHPKD